MNYRTLVVMGYIFNPDGFDWMNIQVTKDNKYTYHHINKAEDGGVSTVENGAILTELSHRFLNLLERYCPKAYDDLQEVFKKISSSMEPPTNEIMKENANNYEQIHYLDIMERYGDNYANYEQSDGLHPNSAGYEIFKEIIKANVPLKPLN